MSQIATPSCQSRFRPDMAEVPTWILNISGLILSSGDHRGEWTSALIEELKKITTIDIQPLIWIGGLEQFLAQCEGEAGSLAWLKQVLSKPGLRFASWLEPGACFEPMERHPSLLRCFRRVAI